MLFQTISIMIMLVFYGCYFAKLLRQRGQNIQTNLLGKGKTGFVKFIEITLKLMTYTIVAAEIVSIFMNWNIAPLWLRMIGAGLGACGVAVFIIALHEMRDSWRAGVPEKAETELVTGGIYRYSRNPAFLGFDLIYIGILCMFLNPLLLAITILTVLMLHLQIVNVEEPFMQNAFGEDYLHYRKQVCRYIGRKMKMSQNKKAKRVFLFGDIVILLLTVALLPLNLFVCNFPAWMVAILGFIAVSGTLIYLLFFQTKTLTKILLPVFVVLIAAVSSLFAFSVPYWNSYSFKQYSGKALNFNDRMTFKQAECDLDEVVSILERTHPMFRSGLTDEIGKRYEEAKAHLSEREQITVNDLRREIQWMLNPMHDAHTSTYNSYPDNRYLKDAPQKFHDGYSILSVNGMKSEELRELAKPYYSYESEAFISVDVGSLSSLTFYGIEAPYTFVWEKEDGEQTAAVYTDEDFVTLEEYIALQDSFTESEQTEEKPFVWYEIDEKRSLAVLTLTQCNTGDYYNDQVRKMFTEVKEKNIQNVAVDLRGNGGGNSGVANEFIRYLPIDIYSDSPSDWRWNFFTLHSDGKMKNDRYHDLTFTGNVYVLTDRNSFSSAMLFPQMIQDNGLGRVIGESPANNVNSYGDIACFYLKESGLFIQVSTKKWYRIDSGNPDDYVIPDIMCDGEDVFESLYEVITQ